MGIVDLRERLDDPGVSTLLALMASTPAGSGRFEVARMLMGWKEEDEVVDRVRSIPPVPTYDTCRARLMETLQHSSSEAYTGAALHSAVTAAGLAPPTLRLEALLGGGGTALPTAARLGAHVPSDLDLDYRLTSGFG